MIKSPCMLILTSNLWNSWLTLELAKWYQVICRILWKNSILIRERKWYSRCEGRVMKVFLRICRARQDYSKEKRISVTKDMNFEDDIRKSFLAFFARKKRALPLQPIDNEAVSKGERPCKDVWLNFFPFLEHSEVPMSLYHSKNDRSCSFCNLSAKNNEISAK